jgi:hypothetical protein
MLSVISFAGNFRLAAVSVRNFTVFAFFNIPRLEIDAIIDISQPKLAANRPDGEAPVQSLINLVTPTAVGLAGEVLDDRRSL